MIGSTIALTNPLPRAGAIEVTKGEPLIPDIALVMKWVKVLIGCLIISVKPSHLSLTHEPIELNQSGVPFSKWGIAWAGTTVSPPWKFTSLFRPSSTCIWPELSITASW